MKNDPVIIEYELEAPVEQVWKAITDKTEMKQWYFDISDFKPEAGFEFQFTGGAENGITYIHLCKITEVEENKKLKYSWRYKDYDGMSFVSFELSPNGNKTRLKLTHEGLETFPENNPDLNRSQFLAGWIHIIGTSLTGYLLGN